MQPTQVIPSPFALLWRRLAQCGPGLKTKEYKVPKEVSGRWVHKSFVQVIRGSSVFGPDGSVTKMKVASKDRFSIVVKGQSHTAKLSGGKLVWDDGDVWTREVAQAPLEGRWTHRSNFGLTDLIAGDNLFTHNGTVFKVTREQNRRVVIHNAGKNRSGQLKSDKLLWDDGDVWIRMQSHTAFDGRWTSKRHRGSTQLIKGYTIYWQDGSETNVSFTDDKHLSLVIRGRSHGAKVVKDELQWDDGDVWVRLQDRESFDGRWTRKANMAVVEVIEDNVLYGPNGSRLKLFSQGPDRIAFRFNGQVHGGRLSGEYLVWDDGDTWMRESEARRLEKLMPEKKKPAHSERAKETLFEVDGLIRLLTNKWILAALLICTPLGFASYLFRLTPTVVFTLNLLAMIPIAWLTGKCVHDLCSSCEPRVAGLLHAVLLNTLEMVLCLASARQGQIAAMHYFLVGAMVAKVLLCFGMVLLLADDLRATHPFKQDIARSQSSLLLFSLIGLVLPTVHGAIAPQSEATLDISRGFAFLMFSMYAQYMVFRSETVYQDTAIAKDKVDLTRWTAAIILAACVCLTFCCAECLFSSMDGTVASWGINKEFVSAVGLPFFSILAQHDLIGAIGHNKVAFQLKLAADSACQTALLVAPFAVLFGWLTGMAVTLDVHLFQAMVLGLSIIVAAQVLSGGQSNWLEGTALTSAYGVVAMCYWFGSGP